MRDHYAVPNDVWADTYARRMAIMRRWEQAAAEGAELLGAHTPAGRRMQDTRDFCAFVQSEIPDFVRRWEEHKTPGSSLSSARRDRTGAPESLKPFVWQTTI